MAAETTLMPPLYNGDASAASAQVRNATIHPVQGPTSDPDIGPRRRIGRRIDRGRRPSWIVLLAFAGIVLMALNLRSAVTSVPPLLDLISADLGFNATVIGTLGALPALAFAGAGLIGIRLVRRFPAERIAIGVLLVEAAGQLIRPWTGSVPGFLAISTLTLLGMGVGNVILPALVKAWFPDRIGPVTASYVTVMAIGTSVPALLAVPIATGLGWQRGLALWGALALLAVPSWVITARHPRARPPSRLLQGDREPGDRRAHRIAVHRSPISWGLALLFGMNALNLYAMFTWLPVRLVDAGATQARAGAELALFAGIGIVPSLLIPTILSRVGRSGLMVAICVVFFVGGYLGLLLAPMTLTSLWTLLAGLGGGGFPLVLTLFGLRSASPATAGALSGFAQAVGYLAAVTGPLLVGLLHDVTGGWTAPFGFLGMTLVLMLVGAWLCSPTTMVDADLRARHAAKAVAPPRTIIG
jgi:CP family cyanate transporter-like MFS transporter